MTSDSTHTFSRNASGAALVYVASALAGLTVALLTLGLFFAVGKYEADNIARRESLACLGRVQANLQSLGEQLHFYADQSARRLSASERGRLSDLVERQEAMWPEVDISLYDGMGEFLPELSGGALEAAPVPRTSRGVVHKALAGKIALDITRSRGFLSFSVAAPMRNAAARVLVSSLPLDGAALTLLKRRADAELAIVPSDDLGGGLDFSLAAGSSAQAEMLWDTVRGLGRGALLAAAPGAALLDDGRALAFAPLKEEGGDVMGLLLVVPLQRPVRGFSLLQLAAALAAGLAAALVAGLSMNRYALRMGTAFAGAVVALAESDGNMAATGAGPWPAPLQIALSRMGKIFKDHKKRIRSVEVELNAADRQLQSQGGQGLSEGEEAYLRLFENAPMGVFQAHAAGAFIRVNQAFAMLLGYDTPVQLMSENHSFTDFCLYGDEIRNPLTMLLEQGGGRQIISLRKRDGGIGSYVLLCVPLTAASGERLAVLEGFLLDRDLEDQIARAEREREGSARQRVSLALLLAATCRQTESYLSLSRLDGPPPALEGPVPGSPDTAAPGAKSGPDAEKDVGKAYPERRRSVQTVNSFLADIYQVAMGEASGTPPVDVPMDFARFLNRVCRLAQNSMLARGISLRCEIAPELMVRMAGPVPMLRHALHRALLTVTAPVQNGWACLSVMRDPNAPRNPGLTRTLFTISWSRHDTPEGAARTGTLGAVKGFTQVYAAPADPEVADAASAALDTGTLEVADEQEVIRFLAEKMRGELLDSHFTNNFRSIQLIVPLGQLGDAAGDAQGEAVVPPAESFAPDAPAFGQDSYELPGLAAEGLAPLDILVTDQVSAVASESGYDEGPDRGLNILLVDDSLNNRLLFSLFLRETRHRITEAHDGQEGVEAFRRNNYDVVFMDMEMPLMDGYQATRVIRALEADSGRPPTPIVGMTSYALPEFRRQCMLSGCTDFLSKPFSKIALFAILDAFAQIRDDNGEAASDDE